jgi:hypothetical protein
MKITFGSKIWITEKPRGEHNVTMIDFGEFIIFLGLYWLEAAEVRYRG